MCTVIFPKGKVSDLYSSWLLWQSRVSATSKFCWSAGLMWFSLHWAWWLCTCSFPLLITLSDAVLFLESSRLFPEDVIPKSLMHFTHIVPVSATTGLGLPLLKSLIRQSLEEQDVIETEGQHSERLLKLRREIPTSSIPSWGFPQQTWDSTYRFGYGSP